MNTLEKLYVSLDAVLDLRQGTINFLSSEFAYAVTTQPQYFLREEDEFGSTAVSSIHHQPWGNLAKETYLSVFAKQPYEVVRGSVRTRIDKFVKHLCAAHLQNSLRQGFEPSIKIELNIHGYGLSAAEGQEIQSGFQHILGPFFRVTVIDVDPIHLTPDVVRENFFGMIMYDYVTWANLHAKDLQKKPLTTTCLYVPRVRFNGAFPQEQLDICAQRKISPWDLMQQVYGGIMPIQYVPVAFFCVAVPQNLDAYTDIQAA